jgi:hypothetical protein
MKRDMELVRKILLAMEAQPHGYTREPLTIPGYHPDTIGHHVWLMSDGGLIAAQNVTTVNDASPVSIPLAILWKGREYLDAEAARDGFRVGERATSIPDSR